MKTVNNGILALATAVLLGTGLYAQNTRAEFPFDFTVQSVTLPAGHYSLHALRTGSEVIRLVNLDTSKLIMVLAARTNAPAVEKASGKIVFHRYGDRYFLSEVWSTNGPRGRVSPSKLEREMQANGTEKEMASISIPLAAG
jgi:hypothetical protein